MAQTWLEKYSTYEDEVTGSATGITAYAGGGQASATQLTAKFNEITVVATNNDSVKLPVAMIGKVVYVLNSDAAQTLRVYAYSGDYVNLTLNGYADVDSVGGGGTPKMFICLKTGYWNATALN